MLTAAIQVVLDDPTASAWLKEALRTAINRDPADAANDAEALYHLLERRLTLALRLAGIK